MRKHPIWQGVASKTTENCTIIQSEVGIEVTGLVVGADEYGAAIEVRYVIEMSPEWQVLHLIIHNELAEGVEVDLRRDNNQWKDAMGNTISHVDDVPLIDIACTPFTNTIALKQLALERGEIKTVSVLYVPTDTFRVRLTEQTYTRLGDHTYQFTDSQFPAFQADIVFDDDDLVLVYPNLFVQKT